MFFFQFRSVTESINGLINICMTSAPGQKECDNALRQMQMMRNVLDNPNEPVNDATYFDCLDGVTDRTKVRELVLFIIFVRTQRKKN